MEISSILLLRTWERLTRARWPDEPTEEVAQRSSCVSCAVAGEGTRAALSPTAATPAARDRIGCFMQDLPKLFKVEADGANLACRWREPQPLMSRSEEHTLNSSHVAIT